jgi:hypothetical protein
VNPAFLAFDNISGPIDPVRPLLSSKDENGLLYVAGYPKSGFLPDSLSEPVIKAEVFVNQETSHLLSLLFSDITKTMPDEVRAEKYLIRCAVY